MKVIHSLRLLTGGILGNGAIAH